MEPVALVRVGRAHGLKGEVTLAPGPLNAAEMEKIGRFTWRGPDRRRRELTLLEARGAQHHLVVRFREVEDRSQAEALQGGWLEVAPESLPDPGPGVAYRFQLLGFEVFTEDGRRLGQVVDILGTGAHDVHVVRGERDWMVPAVPQFLKSVDMEKRRIVVALIEGMEATASGEDSA